MPRGLQSSKSMGLPSQNSTPSNSVKSKSPRSADPTERFKKSLDQVAADTESALPYAPVDSIASVLYYNQELSAEGRDKMTAFTREAIDLTHSLEGKFYSPYRLDATQEQFERNYPGWRAFVERKFQYDPDGLFSNAMFEHYRPKD